MKTSELRDLAGRLALSGEGTLAESLLGLADLIDRGDPVELAEAGDLWFATGQRELPMARMLPDPRDLCCGEDWGGGHAAHHAMACSGALAAVKAKLEELQARARDPRRGR
jgi:hypothetical protein